MCTVVIVQGCCLGENVAIRVQGVGSVWEQRAWEPDQTCEVGVALLRSSVHDKGR